jgi:fatty-acid desaturase
MIGNRPFTQRDRSTNFWALAILSMGESWHNLTTLIPPVPVTASPVASST